MHPNKIKNPGRDWLLVIKDVEQKSIGSILLTEELPYAANIGYYSGRVIKIGVNVASFLNLKEEEILNKRIAFRQYLADAIKFAEKINDQTVFLIHAKDVDLVIDETTDISML